MSYSVLRDIEICPLRWSLRRGKYPAVWSGRGYPSAPAFGTIEGQLVHTTLERIVKAASDGVQRHPLSGEEHFDARGANESRIAMHPIEDLIATLRRLGGITAVLQAELSALVAAWNSNPRMSHRRHEWEAELQRRLPALRQRVQTMLSNSAVVAMPNVESSAVTQPTDVRMQSSRQNQPEPLGPGVFAEVPLNHPDIGWYGKADLLAINLASPILSDGAELECGITDFKTGAQKDDHVLQLRIYALLWARDRALNPSARRARRLTIVYPTETVSVPPPETNAEMRDLEAQLVSRTALAREAIAKSPPDARPSKEACEWCDVRHLCETYWSLAAVDVGSAKPGQQSSTCDVEVLVSSRRSPGSWLGRITAAPSQRLGLSVGASILIRTRPQDGHLAGVIQTGQRVRLVAAQQLPASEESSNAAVVALGRSSEAFRVNGD
jgi:hypothetical protein